MSREAEAGGGSQGSGERKGGKGLLLFVEACVGAALLSGAAKRTRGGEIKEVRSEEGFFLEQSRLGECREPWRFAMDGLNTGWVMAGGDGRKVYRGKKRGMIKTSTGGRRVGGGAKANARGVK